MKRLIALLLVLMMALGMAACSSSSEEGTESVEPTDGFLFQNKDTALELGEPQKTLDPADVYSKLTYNEKMFYGEYELAGGNDARDKYVVEAKYEKWTVGKEELELSALPYSFVAGPNTFSHVINYVEGYSWARLYYGRKYASQAEPSMDEIICAYSVEGNKLILKPLESFDATSEEGKISYAFSDVVWEYTFAFSGRSLTLTSGENKITLTAGLEPYGMYDYLYVDNYLTADSKAIDDIDTFNMRYDGEEGDTYISINFVNNTWGDDAMALLEENGLLTFTTLKDEVAKTYQYVYFYCNDDGLILTDGTEIYYYTDSYADRYKTDLREYLTEDQTGALDALSESQLKLLVEKKENLMDDLVAAFTAAGIEVSVDSKSGELAMDSSILFGGDSAVLTAEGKAFLNKFVEAYTSIVFSEKYEGFVKQTMVEGHTAPQANSTYESGLPLSEERANNVKNYCISSETGVDTLKLAAALDAMGYSNSKPIKDADGNVDMVASRRVSFRFIIDLEQI